MKILGTVCISLLAVSGLFAQHRGGSPQPVVVGGVGSVVHPGGTPATMPSISRSPASVIYPGGGGPHYIVPNTLGTNVRRYGHSGTAGYAYPVYVGGYTYGSYPYEAPYLMPADYGQGYQQAPSTVTVIMPPQQPTPVIINLGPSGDSASVAPPPAAWQPPVRGPVAEPAASDAETPHYLVAFKDHTIYSALAYWVDGDTLHYFTSGNTHNQVSLSLIDRDLTDRLNRESGVDFRLPQAK